MINYFKIRNARAIPPEKLVFFDDHDLSSIEEAYAKAISIQQREGGDLSVFRRPSLGPVLDVKLIGGPE